MRRTRILCPNCNAKMVFSTAPQDGMQVQCARCGKKFRLKGSDGAVAPNAHAASQSGTAGLQFRSMVFGAVGVAVLLAVGYGVWTQFFDREDAGVIAQSDDADSNSANGDDGGVGRDAGLNGPPADGQLAAAGAPEVARNAEAVLRKNCYRCHGDGGSDEGGLNFILRRDKLVADNTYITPGSPTDSYLFERIVDGEMPPDGEGEPISEADRKTLSDWITAGAPDFAAPLDRAFVSNADVYQAIHQDLFTATPERDRRFIRYFTLTNLFNAGYSDDELQTYRLALGKLLNSLSWNRNILHPKSIHPSQSVLRIDLRDLDWTKDVWNTLIKTTPYAIVGSSQTATEIQTAADTKVPSIRVDWFVAAASKAPLYHDALQLPATVPELEKLLRIDVQANIDRERVARAGFARSGVSQNNRLIERHDSPYGAFWISYDFAGNTGDKNLFNHPMGPTGDKAFKHDGGEIIFNLPNGLQGYMLTDEKGTRINKGPVSIVSDPRRPDRTVVNGTSCMSCHYAGIIAKSDEVRKHVETNRNAFPEADDVLALYPTADRIAELQESDANRFQEALAEVGVERLTQTAEPIVNMTELFEANLDLALAASELGVTAAEFRQKLPSFPELSRVLGPLLVEGGSIKRDVYVDVFAKAAKSFGLGEPFSNTSAADDAGGRVAAATSKKDENVEVAVDDGFGATRKWKSKSGKVLTTAEFVSFDGSSTVKLRDANGLGISVPIDTLSEVDRKFVLDNGTAVADAVPDDLPQEALDLPNEVASADGPAGADQPDGPPGLPAGRDNRANPGAPPGAGPPGGDPRRRPGRRIVKRTPRPPVIDPDMRIWTPIDGKREPFRAKFLRIDEKDGLLRLKMPYGIVVKGPIEMLSKEDQEFLKEYLGGSLPSKSYP